MSAGSIRGGVSGFWKIGVVMGACMACAAGSYAAPAMPWIAPRDGSFVDAEGRQVILHGAAVIDKNKATHYLGNTSKDTFASLKDWGFNCIRFGILWDGVEPEPGKFDEEYLKGVDQRIAWARENGIYVFLDMHQDLFSVKFSDGAPAWATLDEGKPHLAQNGVWSDAYFTSLAVQTALDHFWQNAPAPDGVGLQDHYARMWKHVAERYANEPAVVGYDIMNEPFLGSQALPMQFKVLTKLAEILPPQQPGKPLTALDVMKQWGEAAGRSSILKALEDLDAYKAMIDTSQPMLQEFERTQLMPMFQRVALAIREADTKHILFLETSMGSNMGIYSAIDPVNGPDGRRDPLQAYAPHGYDLVTDTPDIASPCNGRVDLIFNRHDETAKRLGMPMLVGEWGAYGRSLHALPAAQHVVQIFERLRCGETYWAYEQNMENWAIFPAIQRPYPASVSGALVSYQTNTDTQGFTCIWREDPAVKAPTCIYLPARIRDAKGKISLSPPGEGYKVESAQAKSKNVFFLIPPTGQAVERTFSIN